MQHPIFDNVPNMGKANSILHIDESQLSENHFISNFVNKNQPCLIRNAIKHWPALNLWKKKSYLKEKCGQHKTYFYPHINYNNLENMRKDESVIAFSEIMDTLIDRCDQLDIASAPYIKIGENGPFSELRNDLKGFSFLSDSVAKPLGYPDKRCFMYKGAATGWHIHHLDETLMCQIKGNKKVALLPPDTATNNIVKEAFASEDYLDSRVLLDHKNANQLQPILVEVTEGDALYIPPFWWHAVVPVDHSFGITLACCWKSPLHIMGDLSYPAVRELWRGAFNPPSKRTLTIFFLGSLSLVAQAVYRIKMNYLSFKERFQ